jgi:serine/threonine protein kinase
VKHHLLADDTAPIWPEPLSSIPRPVFDPLPQRPLSSLSATFHLVLPTDPKPIQERVAFIVEMPSIVAKLPALTGRVFNATLNLDGSTGEGRSVTLQLLARLGSGRLASVYHAVDVATASTTSPIYYAVKCAAPVPSPNSARAAAFMKQVDTECALHARVSYHRHIVRYHGHGFDNGCNLRFLVLDFVPGGILRNAISTGRFWLANDAVRELFSQVVEATAFCHSRGVAHGDISPENVLLSADGHRAYLADFGFAVDLGTAMAAHCAEPHSIETPEVCDAHAPQNPIQADIWSLGLLLISLLTNRSPWKRAHYTDPDFSKFVSSPDKSYFSSVFPISSATNTLLYRIFAYDGKHISSVDLLAAIHTIDTFFMTPLQLEVATAAAKEVAQHSMELKQKSGRH